ncbi:ankyrin [Hypoxylon rubiginosum]|uniref:Ankyrin n=1 Tax=Hypoxylon rubiginosum TaxID=110542 RepID=A0ACC0DIJ4_9PEZI|nr:ankyrin [Hypoxylon rubiginosum]
MPFSDLPNEVVHLILVPAVWVRGLKRAVRLRLVSRTWNAAVEDAIFDSGILDENGLVNRIRREVDFAFWHRYLIYRALHNAKPSSMGLVLIRQTAERIVEMRGRNLADSQEAVRECVGELCHAVLVFGGCGQISTYLAPEAGAIGRLDEDFHLFRRALVSAAAYMNDLDLGRLALSSHPDGRPPNDRAMMYTLGIFFDPYQLAAYRGNKDFISLLLDNETETTIQRSSHRATIAYSAIMGSQMGVLDYALGSSFSTDSSDYMVLRESLVSGLSTIPSIDIFERCFDLVKDRLQHPCRPYNGIHRQKWLLSRLHTAAECGAVPVMEYLVKQGASVNGRFSDKESPFSRPISLAALKGHEDAVKWLLSQGANLDRSLQAAVAGGSRRIMQILMDHGAMNDKSAVKLALLEAVETEREDLFRFLMEHGAVFDDATRKEAVEIAEEEQLESMASFIKGF